MKTEVLKQIREEYKFLPCLIREDSKKIVQSIRKFKKWEGMDIIGEVYHPPMTATSYAKVRELSDGRTKYVIKNIKTDPAEARKRALYIKRKYWKLWNALDKADRVALETFFNL